jgi:uncharacterized protein DUF6152
MRGRRVIVLAVGVLMSAPLLAHHGSAAFDNGKTAVVKGTVAQWVYSNPHCLLSVDAKGEDGTVVRWIIETQAPNIMYPAGYRKDSFKVGDEVTVTVEPVKNGLPIGRIREVILANGTTLGGIGSVPVPPKGQ